MSKATWVNVNGSWREVKNAWVNVNGSWKEKVIPKGYISGSWKEFIGYVHSRVCCVGKNNSIEIYEYDGTNINKVTEIFPNKSDMVVTIAYWDNVNKEFYLVGFYEVNGNNLPYWERYNKNFNLINTATSKKENGEKINPYNFETVSSFGVGDNYVGICIYSNNFNYTRYFIDNKTTGNNILYPMSEYEYTFKIGGKDAQRRIGTKPTLNFINDTSCIDTFDNNWDGQSIYKFDIKEDNQTNKKYLTDLQQLGKYDKRFGSRQTSGRFLDFKFIEEKEKKNLFICSTINNPKNEIIKFNIEENKIVWSIDMLEHEKGETPLVFVLVKDENIGYVIEQNYYYQYKISLKVYKIDLQKGTILDVIDTKDTTAYSCECAYSNGYIYAGKYIFDENLNIINKYTGLDNKNLYCVGGEI